MALPTVYSDAVQAQVESNTPAPGNLGRNRLMSAPFIWTCASEASGTVVGVARLPKGARLISGWIIASATLANSATIAVGLSAVDGSLVTDPATEAWYKTDGTAGTIGTTVADSTTCLKAAAALSTTKVEFLVTTALGFLYETQKELWLTLTTGTGTVSTEIVRGYINYAVD